jgi:uncharacterized membrane protein YvlD (DUF360 family)
MISLFKPQILDIDFVIIRLLQMLFYDMLVFSAVCSLLPCLLRPILTLFVPVPIFLFHFRFEIDVVSLGSLDEKIGRTESTEKLKIQ